VAVEYRSANEQLQSAAQRGADLVRRQVSVIAVLGSTPGGTRLRRHHHASDRLRDQPGLVAELQPAQPFDVQIAFVSPMTTLRPRAS
jgi:hypothetical protein